jgi:hypothetical protein
LLVLFRRFSKPGKIAQEAATEYTPTAEIGLPGERHARKPKKYANINAAKSVALFRCSKRKRGSIGTAELQGFP